MSDQTVARPPGQRELVFSRAEIEISICNDQLLIADRQPVPFTSLVSIRWKGRTVDKDNIFKRARHGWVTIEWEGPDEGLQVVRFEERGGDRKAEKLYEALVSATGFVAS